MKFISFLGLSLLVLTVFGSDSAFAAKGSSSGGSSSSSSLDDSLKANSLDDDGTPDQGKGDFNVDGTPAFTPGSDDGTPDQGRGDINADGIPTDDSSLDDIGENEKEDFMKSIRSWFARIFSWSFF